MDEHTPKKRKLNPVTALHRPFKSPFRGATIPSSPVSNTELPSSRSAAPELLLPSSPIAGQRRPPGPRLQSLQRERTALLARARQLRSELDTVQQAVKIEEADKDDELHRLIDIWRLASRNAAEEIFATVRDRVNKMGGVVAWKKREQDRKERLEEWAKEGQDENSDDSNDGSDDDDDEGTKIDSVERARRQDAREDARTAKAAAREARRLAQAEAAAEQDGRSGQAKQVEDLADDLGFTMDMMLKEMKIDLDLIGFDAGCQKWVD